MKFNSGWLLALIVGLMLVLQGCYVASIHPIAQPDQRVFDANLVGVWVNSASNDTLTITGNDIDNLKFRVSEAPNPAGEKARSGELGLLLTSIKGQNYMDVRPTELLEIPIPVFEQMLLVPMHAIIRYNIHGDTLKTAHLNYHEFNARNRSGKAFGLDLERVTNDGPILITSATDKIRKMLGKVEANEHVWEAPTAYVRVPTR